MNDATLGRGNEEISEATEDDESTLQNSGRNIRTNLIRSTSYHPVDNGNCAPEALAVGIRHYRYAQASANDLVNIEGGKQLHRDAANALRALQARARQDGVTLTVLSGFRSVEHQRRIVQRKKAAGQSARQIYYTSSYPGFSEHHTGFAVDFNSLQYGFENTKAYQWLVRNAPAMGWKQSFTRESSRENGVSYEPWHWKYVGSPNAQRALPNWTPGACPR